MFRLRRRPLGVLLAVGLAVALLASVQSVRTTPARAQSGENLQRLLDFYYRYFGGGSSEAALKSEATGTMARRHVARSQPRECFYTNYKVNASPSDTEVADYGTPVGGPLPGTGYTCNPASRTVNVAGTPTTFTGVPKINESYVWSMAKGTGNQIWFGTSPNIVCSGSAEIFGLFGTTPSPSRSDLTACEYARSKFAVDPDNQYPALVNQMGDWRPPQIYRFNVKTNRLDTLTPVDPLLKDTFGLRGGGSHQGVVFLAGPSITRGVVNVFAFNASDGTYLGSRPFDDYSNIRRFTVTGGVLYAGVGVDPGGALGATCRGAVLRWRGSLSDPFNFERVACTDAEVAEVAAHDGRLYGSTWPPLGPGATQIVEKVASGIWMSPRLGRSGLSAASASQWKKVFTWSEYEQSPGIALTYGGGPLISYGGKLFATSMHVPATSLVGHIVFEREPQCNGDVACAFSAYNGEIAAACPAGPDQATCRKQFQQDAFLGTLRATVMVRLDNLETTSPTKELLYGMPVQPAWDAGNGEFATTSTRLGFPRYGLAGYGNLFNSYSWAAAVQNGRLFVSTFDFSFLYDKDPASQINELRGLRLSSSAWGADLIKFTSATSRGTLEISGGANNYLNYGFRNMVPLADGLLLGSANPFNLATDPNHPDGVLGGWELVRLVG